MRRFNTSESVNISLSKLLVQLCVMSLYRRALLRADATMYQLHKKLPDLPDILAMHTVSCSRCIWRRLSDHFVVFFSSAEHEGDKRFQHTGAEFHFRFCVFPSARGTHGPQRRQLSHGIERENPPSPYRKGMFPKVCLADLRPQKQITSVLQEDNSTGSAALCRRSVTLLGLQHRRFSW